MSLLLGLLTPPPAFTFQQLAYYPDYIQRARSLAHQQYVFQAMIDRTSPLADVRYPDRVDRPRAQQPAAFTTSPQPERTAPLEDTRFPDRIDRPKAQQQLYFATSPQPERTASLADANYPDCISRPKAQQQQYFALWPQPLPDVTYVTVVYPDFLPRRAPQQPSGSTLAPQPEQTIAQALVVVPTAIPRARQTPGWFALDPKPEETIQLDWQPRYPDRLDRRQMRPADLPFFTFNVQPEQPGPQALAIYPAAIDRPRRVPGWFALDPKPEETTQLDWHGYQPAQLDRRSVRPADVPFLFFDPKPEQTIAQALAVYPASIDRPRRTPGWFALDPKPEQAIALDWHAVYPDRLPRLTPQQQAFTTDPKPESTVPSAYVYYPDRLEHREVQTSVHVAFVFNPQPEAPLPYFNLIYPDRIDRPYVPPSQQPYFTTSPEPEQTSPLADTIYPDLLPRLYPQHRSFVLDPQPEETNPHDWQAIYVDRVERAFAKPELYQAFALDPFPLPNPPTPPPPPPPKPPPPARLIRAVGGSRAIQIDRPLCPPGHTWVWDKYHWICVPEKKQAEADYAILPLVDEVIVKALVDGMVETFKDEKGKIVVRLTADDGTTYFYAKVTKVKSGRVKRGDVIGVSTEASIAPKALPQPSSEPQPPTQKQKGVFGVLPVAPPKPPPPAPKPPPPAKYLAAPPPRYASSMARRVPTLGEQIILGVGVVGAAIAIAAVIRSIRRKPARKKKKKRKKKRRR